MENLLITGEALIVGLLLFLNIKLKKIVMTQAELQAELLALKAQNEKAKGEIIAKFAALEGALANQGNTTPEVDAALADLKVSVQGTDDIVPDEAPATEPVV